MWGGAGVQSQRCSLVKSAGLALATHSLLVGTRRRTATPGEA